ncbi:hypothetical protein H8A97_41500 [Bradyrhizobium sp. Arg62]|nr:hypothetical protein [Bradyrhizobium ivorense]MCC8951352.1 hypothetical protein [Bradyrhizobium brasilense]
MIAESDYAALLLTLPRPELEIAKADIEYLVNCMYMVSASAQLSPTEAELVVGDVLSRLACVGRQLHPSTEGLSYEDMILMNPLQSDPRVYCVGVAGVEERDFCLAHQLIESELQSAMDALIGLRDNTATDARGCLETCLDKLETANYILSKFNDMSSALFGEFRVFYGANPYKSRLGPSGRFSARVVAVSVLLIGEELFRQKPQFYCDLYRLSEHYPQSCIHEIFRWLSPDDESGRLKPRWLSGQANFPTSATIMPIIERRGHELGRLAASCVRVLDHFIRMHRSAALRFTVQPGLPVSGAASSESVEAVLDQRLLTARRRDKNT